MDGGVSNTSDDDGWISDISNLDPSLSFSLYDYTAECATANTLPNTCSKRGEPAAHP